MLSKQVRGDARPLPQLTPLPSARLARKSPPSGYLAAADTTWGALSIFVSMWGRGEEGGPSSPLGRRAASTLPPGQGATGQGTAGSC